MSAQSRIVAILFVVGVTMIAAVIYVRDVLVFDHGVQAVRACGESVQLGSSADELAAKLRSDICAGLVQVDVVRPDGSLRMHGHHTSFHDDWHVVFETKANAVSAVRYRSKQSRQAPQKGAPPDRVSAR